VHSATRPEIYSSTESVNDYIRRFWDTRNRCFRIHVADKELAGLTFNGCYPTEETNYMH
jgi:hypothetical protein